MSKRIAQLNCVFWAIGCFALFVLLQPIIWGIASWWCAVEWLDEVKRNWDSEMAPYEHSSEVGGSP